MLNIIMMSLLPKQLSRAQVCSSRNVRFRDNLNCVLQATFTNLSFLPIPSTDGWAIEPLSHGTRTYLVTACRAHIQYNSISFSVVVRSDVDDDNGEEEDLNDRVETDAVPNEVRDWLAMTFTRSNHSAVKRRVNDKPKFRSVANAIRAGILVDRCVSVFVCAASEYLYSAEQESSVIWYDCSNVSLRSKLQFK